MAGIEGHSDGPGDGVAPALSVEVSRILRAAASGPMLPACSGATITSVARLSSRMYSHS